MIRLLHFDKAGELVYTEFQENSTPPYAILSHRWGDGEVLFEHVRNGTWKGKAGRQKIEFCAATAARDGLEYFWIDTCCIDKWNLQELSRSINSMFCWYRDAQKCYAFLSDIKISDEANVTQQHVWEKEFRDSQWFTRGWTLQELIAPKFVEFFSREGFSLGDKEVFELIIQDITHIPVAALRGRDLSQFDINERMKWAASRTTTEPEDEVYCLLGVLGVFMPVSYGEGAKSARERLQEALHISSRAPFLVPLPKSLHFVGCERELVALDKFLLEHQRDNRLGIIGSGGTGKSQLALEFAYRCKDAHIECTIIWIDATTIDSLYLSYASICQKLEIPGWDDEKADVLQLVKDHFSQPCSGRWLLVYDNTNDATLKSTGLSAPLSKELAKYLPNSETGSIIFTSTSMDITTPLAISEVIELEAMMPENAREMFERYLERRLLPDERNETLSLLQRLAYLPLAIVQAATYIKIQHTTIQGYCALLTTANQQGTGLSGGADESENHDNTINDVVLSTLLISLQQIQRERPTAVHQLFVAACLDSTDISLELLITPPGLEIREDIMTLSRYNLVTRRPAESAVDIHRLVHAGLRKWLQDQSQLKHWQQETIRRLLRVFPDDRNEARSKWRRLLPHTHFALSQYNIDTLVNEDQIRLMQKCALTLQNDGRWTEAERLLKQVIISYQFKFVTDCVHYARSLNNLGAAYGSQGKWTEAEQQVIRAKTILEKEFGPDDPHTLSTISNLAYIYTLQGHWEKAEHLQLQVLDSRRKKLGVDHPDTLSVMNGLSSTYQQQGQWAKAEKLLNEVIAGRNSKRGSDDPETLASMNNLALVYCEQRRLPEAERLQIQVIEKIEPKLGADHPSVLSSKANLGVIYMYQKRWAEAEPLFTEIVETRKLKLGKDNSDTLASMNNLASVYSERGLLTEAEQLQKEVVDIMKEKYGPVHPSTLSDMANLAMIYYDQGRIVEAIEVQTHVAENMESRFGIDHPKTKVVLTSLAVMRRAHEELEEVEPFRLIAFNADPANPQSITTTILAGAEARKRQKELDELFGVEKTDTELISG